jgi:TetR/AcrR family fatty acid metabolism transcriptional regulator
VSKKKEAILRAATVLFSNKGYRQTSIAELSRLTGVAEGTIFYHFKTKEDIFLSVLKSVKKRLDHAIKKAGGLEKTLAAVSVYLDLCGQMQDEFLMLQRHYPYQISRRNPECRALLEAITGGFLGLFETALDAGQADGSIDVESTRKTAMILYALTDGFARLQTYNIYDSGALYGEFMRVCRRMLAVSGRSVPSNVQPI